MRIGLFHGFELTGSGSNEYTRYLAKALKAEGHDVHVICRESRPEEIGFISHAYSWGVDGTPTLLFEKESVEGTCTLHQMPNAQVRPVYLTDKQREGNVKSFVNLSEEERKAYHELSVAVLKNILTEHRLDILHANHLVYQPIIANEACKATGTPFVIYPHGSSVEYTVKEDDRYHRLAIDPLVNAQGLIIGNHEVRDRITGLYSRYKNLILEKTDIVGVGVDTALFNPVAKEDRQASIDQLVNELAGAPQGGKTSSLTEALYGRLELEGVQPTRGYWEAYNHSLPDADLITKLADIPWDKNIMLFVGALTYGKGLQSVIAALPAILNKEPDTHLVIVGSGAYREVLEGLVYAIATANSSLLFELARKGQELDRSDMNGPWQDVLHYLTGPGHVDQLFEQGKSLRKHVHFLGRFNHDQLRCVFPCADVAVFPSVVPEAYPLVLMESLANGVVPMVSYFSGFKDGVDELEPYLGEELTDNIRLPIDAADRVPAISRKVSEVLSNREMVDTHLLRKIAVDNYDWSLRAKQMTTSYEKFSKALVTEQAA